MNMDANAAECSYEESRQNNVDAQKVCATAARVDGKNFKNHESRT